MRKLVGLEMARRIPLNLNVYTLFLKNKTGKTKPMERKTKKKN
jgi:hypothetical protein